MKILCYYSRRTIPLLIFVCIAAPYAECIAQPNNQKPDHRELLQELIAAERSLDGIRIDDVQNQNGVWRLKGIIANKQQRQQLRDISTKYFGRVGQGQEQEVDLSDFLSPHAKFVPLADFKAVLQRAISEIPQLSGTRIDRVYFGRDGHLQLEGICWPTGQDPLPNEENKEKLFDNLVTTTMAVVVRNRDRWSELTEGGRVVVDGMQYFPPDRSPLRYVRQMIAADARLDGTHVAQSFYGPDGRLIFKGIASDNSQNTLLRHKINAAAIQNANWRAWIGKDSAFTFDVTDFISNRQKIRAIEIKMQCAILSTPILVTAPKGVDLTDKVFIKRLYYTADNKLALTGLRWNEVPQKNNPAQIGIPALHQILLEKQRDDPGLKGEGIDISGVTLFNLANIPFRSPLAASWEMIPKHRNLDGLRLDRAYYEGGVLHFTGIQAKEGQTALLTKQIPLAGPLWKTLAPKGIAFDAFSIVNTETLLDDIQKEYAFHAQTPELDGARIDRIFYRFDQKQQALRPVFSVDRWYTGQAAGVLQPEDIEATTIEKILETPPAKWSSVTEGGCADYQPANERENPLPRLREEVAANPLFDGTRIDRAFYDPAGTLYFEGLIGDEEQLLAVDELVQTTLNQMGAGLSGYAPQGIAVNSDRFRLIPNAIVLHWIQDLLPGYQELDGSGVSRLYFASNNALSVDGRIAKQNQTEDMGKILDQALQQTEWGRELLKQNTNNVVQTKRFDVFKVPHHPYEAMSLLSTAWQIFFCGDYDSAIKKLDMAILYDPGNTQLWMLRSLCYVGMHKLEYARRDARRAVMSMSNNKYRYHGRFKTLSRVQGPLRLCFEALMLEVWASRPNGAIIFMPLPTF